MPKNYPKKRAKISGPGNVSSMEFQDKSSMMDYMYALNFPMAAGNVKVPFMTSSSSSLARYTVRSTFKVENDGGGNLGKYLIFKPYGLNSATSSQTLVKTNPIDNNNQIDVSVSTNLITSRSLDTFADSVRIVGCTMTVDYIDKWDDYSGFATYLSSPGVLQELDFSFNTDVQDLYNDDNTRTCKVKDMPITMRYKPIKAEDLEFGRGTGGGTGAKSKYEAGVALQGTKNNGDFLCTVQVLVEYIPKLDVGWYVPGFPAPEEAAAHDFWKHAREARQAEVNSGYAGHGGGPEDHRREGVVAGTEYGQNGEEYLYPGHPPPPDDGSQVGFANVYSHYPPQSKYGGGSITQEFQRARQVLYDMYMAPRKIAESISDTIVGQVDTKEAEAEGLRSFTDTLYDAASATAYSTLGALTAGAGLVTGSIYKTAANLGQYISDSLVDRNIRIELDEAKKFERKLEQQQMEIAPPHYQGERESVEQFYSKMKYVTRRMAQEALKKERREAREKAYQQGKVYDKDVGDKEAYDTAHEAMDQDELEPLDEIQAPPVHS